MKNDRFIIQISKFAGILVILIYMIAVTAKSSQGYEISIYAMYPSIFWILIITTISLAVIAITLSDYWKLQKLWILPFILTLILYIIFLSLPLIRGYYMVNWGDTPSHLAWAQHIINTGTLNTFYPLFHIQLVTWQFSGVTLETAAQLLSGFYAIICILGLSILGRSLQRGSRFTLFSILFGLPLVYGYYTAGGTLPQLNALYMLPFFYYALFNNYYNSTHKIANLILITIFSVFISLYHPLNALFFIIMTFGLIVTIIIFKWNDKCSYFRNLLVQSFMIITIIFFFWAIFSSQKILRMGGRIFDILINSESQSQYVSILNTQIYTVQASKSSIFYIIEVIMRWYGPTIIFLSISLLCILIVINNFRLKRTSKLEILFFIQYIIALIFFFILISGYFIVAELDRAILQILLSASIFMPVVLSNEVLNVVSKEKKQVMYLFIALSIIFVSSISIFFIFYNPLMLKQNEHFSSFDKAGVDWFLIHQDLDIPLLHDKIYYTHKKYTTFFVEHSYRSNDEIMDKYSKIQLFPTYASSIYNKVFYIADIVPLGQWYFHSTKYSRGWKLLNRPDVIKENVYHTGLEVFDRLKQDRTIDLIYNNKEYESWYIPIKHYS